MVKVFFVVFPFALSCRWLQKFHFAQMFFQSFVTHTACNDSIIGKHPSCLPYILPFLQSHANQSILDGLLVQIGLVFLLLVLFADGFSVKYLRRSFTLEDMQITSVNQFIVLCIHEDHSLIATDLMLMFMALPKILSQVPAT